MNRLARLLSIACLGVFMSASQLVAATTLTTLYSFGSPTSDGYNPYAGLVEGSDGNFYGTAYLGGTGTLNGTVFRITPTGTFTLLHTFHGTFAGGDGTHPYAGLVQGDDGYFYGTTISGGTGNNGSVFRIDSNGGFETIHSFVQGEGASPYGGLVDGHDGYLYGTTSVGGNGGGTVFRITPTGSLTTLHSFTGTDGSGPQAALVRGNDGNLYGTTLKGGTNDRGTVFRIGTDGGFASLHSFTGPDGEGPQAPLVQGSDGDFYGSTWFGGANPPGGCIFCGNLFRIGSSGAFANLYSFQGAPNDGLFPYGALVQASDGNFYGTTSGGGANPACEDGTCGTVFRLSPTGTVTVVYSFGGSDGARPYGALVQGSDGSFYGTTRDGGAKNLGAIFKLTITEEPTTSTTLPPSCTAGTPSACDDGDACTDEPCTTPCTHTERPRGTAEGVVCRVGNMQAILDESTSPACEGRCPNILKQRFAKVTQLTDLATRATTTKKCARKLKAAARNAKTLDRLIARLVGKGRIVPPNRAERLRAQSMILAESYGLLAASDFCAHR